jgi:predicted DNA-binding transcriptional regulator YafY
MATRYAARLERIVRILIEVKCRPRQQNDNILSRLGVSRAQYYKDRKLLDQLGFRFHFDRRRREFVIDQDRYLPTPDLALSERMALILAVRHPCGLGDSTLSHHAAETGRKLIAGLDGSLPDGVVSLFEDVVVTEGFGSDEAVLEKLNQALAEKRRIRILYSKPASTAPALYEIDPYCLSLQNRSLYLEAYSVARRAIRTYRVNRIREIQFTPVHFQGQQGYSFCKRNRWTFSVLAGKNAERVTVRFTSRVKPYIEETCWHHSQKLTPTEDGDILLTVNVAEPREVLWWALGWGADAEIIEPEWLRREASEVVTRMGRCYKP